MSDRFNRKESEILALHAKGLSTRKTAERLGLHPTTVRRVMRRLGVEVCGKRGRPRLDVPQWAPPYLVPLYRRVAAVGSEEAAELLVRRVKGEVDSMRGDTSCARV